MTTRQRFTPDSPDPTGEKYLSGHRNTTTRQPDNMKTRQRFTPESPDPTGERYLSGHHTTR